MDKKKKYKKRNPKIKKSPKANRSYSINSCHTPTSKSRRSAANTKHSVKRSETSASHEKLASNSPAKQKSPIEVEYSFPKHIDVIDRLRKIKNFSQILPFSPEIPPAVMRIDYLAYSKPSLSLVNRIQKRKEKADYEVLEEKNMEKLLKRIKETERIIRQENGFIGKIRKFKPKIKLVKSFREELDLKERKVKSFRNSTPRNIIRSGIQAKVCYRSE